MSGKLGSANLSAGVMTLLYTAPVGKVPTVSARVVNRNPFAIRSTIAIGAGASPVEALNRLVCRCRLVKRFG